MSAKASKPFLGLAILATHLHPGEVPTLRSMQIFCQSADEPITHQRLQQIEQRALRKCRIRLRQRGITELEIKSALRSFR